MARYPNLGVNSVCSQCLNACKQSDSVTLFRCPKFNPVPKVDNPTETPITSEAKIIEARREKVGSFYQRLVHRPHRQGKGLKIANFRV
jgi:hypothetical protein